MGFLETLTLILVVCKLAGVGAITNWTWFQIFYPIIGFYGFMFILLIIHFSINKL